LNYPIIKKEKSKYRFIDVTSAHSRLSLKILKTVSSPLIAKFNRCVDYIVEFAKTTEPQLDLIRSECFDVSSVTIYRKENEITYKVNEYYKFLYSDVFN
jgi:hypothetical protein